MTLKYKFTELPSLEDLMIEYDVTSKSQTNDKLDTATSFIVNIDHSCLSLIDFLIVVGIEFLKVVFFNKPIYLEVEGNNQIFNEEKVPTYIQARKKKHLLDEKEIPIFKTLITVLLVVKDLMILPLSLIAFKYESISGLVQYGSIFLHTFSSPQVLLSFQHLAYSRLAVIQDIADDTEKEQTVDKVITYLMHFIRIYFLVIIMATIPLIVMGSLFSLVISSIYSLSALGLFIPGLIVIYLLKQRGFSSNYFIPIILIIFIGVGLVTLISYAISVGSLLSDSQSIKSIFQFYLGPNTFNFWYFASSKQSSWRDTLYLVIRIIAVI